VQVLWQSNAQASHGASLTAEKHDLVYLFLAFTLFCVLWIQIQELRTVSYDCMCIPKCKIYSCIRLISGRVILREKTHRLKNTVVFHCCLNSSLKPALIFRNFLMISRKNNSKLIWFSQHWKSTINKCRANNTLNEMPYLTEFLLQNNFSS
jgi:hypothetical protein